MVVWVNFNITYWKHKRTISDDVCFYYSYLPAVFYYDDLSLSFLNDTVNQKIEDTYFFPRVTPTGNYVIKSTYGMSLTYLPFFAGAHVYAKLFGYPVDGYSEPYHFAVQFSSLFYFLLGLAFLIKLLKRFFTDGIIFSALFITIFGTNALYYLTVGAGMSHAAGFGFVCCFMYYSVLWHERPSFKAILMIGFMGALVTLIRPINIIVFAFFVFYNVQTLKDLINRIRLFFRYKFHILLLGIIGVLVFLPQLLYWKQQSGHYFFNSYVGEHFFFAHPQIINGLFSYRKGWLVYTPVMVFALAGFYFLYRKNRSFFYAVIFVFIPYVYVAFSWWCWWYGGSYGQRSLIDIYPFLVLPLCAFLNWLYSEPRLKKGIVYGSIALLVPLNLFQSMQAKWNIIHYDSMTKAAYWDAFLRLAKNPDREKFLQHPDDEKAKAGVREY